MAFRDKYTTADIINLQKTLEAAATEVVGTEMLLSPNEEGKLIISNDAFAVGEMLESLIEQISFRMGRL